jgi:hypothetical protein
VCRPAACRRPDGLMLVCSFWNPHPQRGSSGACPHHSKSHPKSKKCASLLIEAALYFPITSGHLELAKLAHVHLLLVEESSTVKGLRDPYSSRQVPPQMKKASFSAEQGRSSAYLCALLPGDNISPTTCRSHCCLLLLGCSS